MCVCVYLYTKKPARRLPTRYGRKRERNRGLRRLLLPSQSIFFKKKMIVGSDVKIPSFTFRPVA